ncbi:pyrroloquinoline quinone biosynthesis peptide chaperone PqqD [Bosea sp. 124]|uniref:pyrroloquinoline quinone biosynthesis peptide chaperone PqqD n=1 Tax=Bosea sp. 124 TaxID=2135642 RepID=UPI000D3C9710|nr:pyrroloquinoline quinone biosynthesis peptide chaperone PqqD [Bosea sp. 124]PTM39591.1 pyrroloquinoline quinone biosynthesis protein D [Bosea sp. 124]
MIGLDTRPKLARGVRVQADRVRGGFNLLAPEHVLRVNTSSAAILNLCDGQRSLREIVDRLAEEYQVDRGRIERETNALLQDLIARRMVET